MELEKRIKLDLNSAMIGKRELEVSVLRQLLAAVFNKEKEKRFKLFKSKEFEEGRPSSLSVAGAPEAKDIPLTEEEMIEVISSEAKKRTEAIEFYVKGNRPELTEKEKKELEILKKYLPQQLSEDDVRKLVKDAVEKTGAKDIKDMGKVMAELMPKVKGMADGNLVSKIVKEALCS